MRGIKGIESNIITARKAIMYDLDTTVLKEQFGQNKAIGWSRLVKAFKNQGFEHLQGSGFISYEGITVLEAERRIKIVIDSCPWVIKAMRDIRVSDYTPTGLDATISNYLKSKKSKENYNKWAATNVATNI